MYISLKIDKSQWCKKTYQVIAYSLIKKLLVKTPLANKIQKNNVSLTLLMHHQGFNAPKVTILLFSSI